MSSKTEVVQLDYSSGIGVQIMHEKKLFFIHSFQIELYNGTDYPIVVKEPISSFILTPGGKFPRSMNEDRVMTELKPNETVSGKKESVWQIRNSFQLTASVLYEMDGKGQVIDISERLGD